MILVDTSVWVEHLRSASAILSALLDRFLVYGETTTSLINASPVPRRDPPVVSED